MKCFPDVTCCRPRWLLWCVLAGSWLPFPQASGQPPATRLEQNGIIVGVDGAKGASITWLSFADSGNVVNIADPGRLIQQSYYAGRSLDRQTETQHTAWSPWPWNPIQGGGVGAWAQAGILRREQDRLYSETTPKLWDMADERAAAVMKQWTEFEPALPNVVRVTCEFVCLRENDDRWGAAVPRGQELPACYFTRKFSRVASYLGEGRWRDERYRPGPPWFQVRPPLAAMGCFDQKDRGVAVFSPVATKPWNFGAAGAMGRNRLEDKPCMHLAPIEVLRLGPQSSLRYRYWLVVGTQSDVAASLDTLMGRYRGESLTLTTSADPEESEKEHHAQ